MKKVVLLLVISVLSLNSYSQKNFKAEDNQIIWQQVFEFENTNLLADYFKTLNFTNNLIITNTTLSGISNKHQLTNKKGLPFYAFQDFTAFCTIELKENRYRVTIKNITFDGIEISFGGVSDKSNKPIEFYILKKDGSFRKNKNHKLVLERLNSFFKNTFEYKQSSDSSW